jgi:hypothetical protein
MKSTEQPMQSSDEMRITWPGRVIVEKGMVVVHGFSTENASCRELAIMASAWAIGELQREMLKTIERPGGGNIGIGEPDDTGLNEAAGTVELCIDQDGAPLLAHEGSLKEVLLYAAGQLSGADRLLFISQLQASHPDMESRFR